MQPKQTTDDAIKQKFEKFVGTDYDYLIISYGNKSNSNFGWDTIPQYSFNVESEVYNPP